MAGFSKIFVIGGLGGVQGADGVNPIQMQIWVGDADRQWLEPHYVDRAIKPLGAIQAIVPEKPDDPNSLLDACIVFYPKHFEQCPTLAKAAALLEGMTRLDFDQGKKSIPTLWPKLREEARPHFGRLHIFEAVLHQGLRIKSYRDSHWQRARLRETADSTRHSTACPRGSALTDGVSASSRRAFAVGPDSRRHSSS